MKSLELAAYSYWQHARRARRAIASGDVGAVADAVYTIDQIGDYAKAPSLVRCCEATGDVLRRTAIRRFGRVSFFSACRPLFRTRAAAAPTTSDPLPPGAA